MNILKHEALALYVIVHDYIEARQKLGIANPDWALGVYTRLQNELTDYQKVEENKVTPNKAR